ncbi:hydrocephalus-inducing protein-like isoform X4 [Agelaius phoeniceus]|uniref:hydrocephalus-inducing protein-like isoform X4 n=1 Tax=Agelaius phoeniceus TaxID=39638 RepID=UPI004054E738
MINSSCSFSVSCSSDNKELNSNPAFILPGYSHQESRSNGCLNGYLCPSPGFPYTRRCRLTNSSPVPLTFQLRMSDDGTQPAVDSVDQIRRDTDPAWRKGIHFYVEPREFTMNPSQGTILPQGHQDIEVTLCSNTVMEFYQRMLVDLEGIGKGVATLIITARCLVLELQLSPQVLLYDECHLKVPYDRKILIRNPKHLPGCDRLIPQKRKEDSAMLYSSPKPCGIVQPQSTAEIPVVGAVQALGTHRTNVVIGVFGDERNPLKGAEAAGSKA